MKVKAGLKPKAVEILRRVAAHIVEEPKRFNMHHWGIGYSKEAADVKSLSVPACRTTGCVAGWVIFLKKPMLWKQLLRYAQAEDIESSGNYELDSISDPPTLAQEILGITELQARNLFYLEGISGSYGSDQSVGWPLKYFTAFSNAKSQKQEAKVAAARILHFVDTDGAE